MRIQLIAAVLCLSGLNVWGAEAENGSEFQYQAPAGTLDVEGQLSIQSGSDIKGFDQEVSAEYGFNSSLSLKLDLNFGYLYTSGQQTLTGMSEPSLTLKGRYRLGPGSLRYGAEAAIAVENSRTYADGSSNLSSGGSSIIPFVGYEVVADSNVFGARISYSILGDRKHDDNGTTSTDKGGNQLSSHLFFEHRFEEVTLGAAVQLLNRESSTTTGIGQGISASNAMGFRIYTAAYMTKSVALLGDVNYSQPLGNGTNGVGNWLVDLGVRAAVF